MTLAIATFILGLAVGCLATCLLLAAARYIGEGEEG